MKTKIFVTTGVAAAAFLFGGAAVASAAPDVEAIVNSTCTYPQVSSALHATSPQVAAELEASPMAVSWIQNLLNSGPDERRAALNQIAGFPQLDGYTSVINSVAYSCQNY